MSKIKSSLIKFFKSFTLFEILFISLSLLSVVVVSVIFKSDALSLAFSIVAIIAVFALSKGVFIAPIYNIAMDILYCLQASRQNLYGEIILNAAILVPIQIVSMINWGINKSKQGEIQINSIGWKEICIVLSCAVALIVPVYFMLKAFNTNYIYLSVVTFIFPIVSNYFIFRKSILQFVSFFIQNIVLIVVWLMPIFQGNASFGMLPMALTFVIFEINNVYGFINWSKKQKEQQAKRETKIREKIEKINQTHPYLKEFCTLSSKNQTFKQKRRKLWNF